MVQLYSLLLAGQKKVILAQATQPCKICCEIILFLFPPKRGDSYSDVFDTVGCLGAAAQTKCEDLTQR